MGALMSFFVKQKTAYEILAGLEFRRVLFRSHPDYTTTTIRNNGQIPKAVQISAHKKREHYEQQWRNLMTQGKTENVIREELDEQLFRLMVLGCLNWSSVWYKPNAATIDDLVKQYADIFLNGCR